MQRCNWPNLENSTLYIDYHDNEWGIPSHDDKHLFEMFVLESFHCGLSWLLILKKRENFREAFNNFDAIKISNYLWGFTDHKVVYNPFDGVTTRNELSDKVSKDLKKRGFKFMGTVTCYSYLEAVGIMNDHATDCFKYIKPEDR